MRGLTVARFHRLSRRILGRLLVRSASLRLLLRPSLEGLPQGPAKRAGRKTKSPTSAAIISVSMRIPNRWVGVKVLNANTDKPSPAIKVVCVIAVAHRS